MTRLDLRHALLPDGSVAGVRLEVEGGLISEVKVVGQDVGSSAGT